MNLYEKTASELSKMLAAKEISAEELTNAVLKRADETENEIDAYITQTRDLALGQAKAVDTKRASGEKLSPLAGIPIAVNDNIGVKDVHMTCASKMLENYIPPFSATAVDKIIAGGAVITGKTNLDEFAIGSFCDTSYFKKTCNPHDTNRAAGGASGGSAAALAVGGAVLALASDTGGAARLPAAYCGVVGLRPTYGAVSRHGLAAFASSLDQISPMARSVQDAAMLLSAICGVDKMDATAANREYPDFASMLDSDIKGRIIGIPTEYFAAVTDKDIKDIVMAAMKKLEDAGAKIKEISLPSTKHALAVYYAISSAEASSNLAKYDGVRFGHRAASYADVNELIEKSRTEGFGDEVKSRVMLGTNILSAQYFEAYYKRAALTRERIKAELETALAGCDCLIAPVSPSGAPIISEVANNPAKMYETDICNVGASLAGLPAISLPCGRTQDDLPCGMQIIGKKFGELDVLQMAYHYEQNVYAETMPEIKSKGKGGSPK